MGAKIVSEPDRESLDNDRAILRLREVLFIDNQEASNLSCPEIAADRIH